MPWINEAVGTAQWTGTPLRHVLDRAGLRDDAVDIAFIGADRGFDRGHEHAFGRSLKREVALSDDVLLVWAMNGAPLLPQHGFPLRLIVPGWYGMASVKWLDPHRGAGASPSTASSRSRAITTARSPTARRTPITHMRVKSLLVPPGHSRLVYAPAGWWMRAPSSSSAAPGPAAACRSRSVEVGIDGAWRRGRARSAAGQVCLARLASACGTRKPASTSCACRATDANGETQPLEPRWDAGGFGNNVVQRVRVKVR